MQNDNEHHRENDVSLAIVNEVLVSIEKSIIRIETNAKENMIKIEGIHKAMWDKFDKQSEKISVLDTKIEVNNNENKHQARDIALIISFVAGVITFVASYVVVAIKKG